MSMIDKSLQHQVPQPKTIGMVTFYKDNYGAFMQAYALQQTLIKLGHRPELIRYEYDNDHAIVGVPFDEAKESVIHFLCRVLIMTLRYPEHRKRKKSFQDNIDKFLYQSKSKYTSYKALEEEPPHYDVYLTGSDQMFNPHISPQAMGAKLLRFASGVKASYAASAGGSQIVPEFWDYFVEAVADFKQISVRESGLKEHLEQRMNKEILHHIDPSLLLTKEEWESFGTRPPIEGEYIFFYPAGDGKGMEAQVNEMSKKLNLPVFVADKKINVDRQISRKGYLTPQEWVGGLANATYVVTNSFHGTAFSINLHKKVYIIKPKKRPERILDLLAHCKLERLLSNEIISAEENRNMFQFADAYLREQRNRSVEYLEMLCNDAYLNANQTEFKG